MWFIRILLLIIIFLGGVYVGNNFVPQLDAASAVAVAMPPLENYGADISNYNFEKAQKTLSDMKAVINGNKELFPPALTDAWFNELNMTLALQNYQRACSRYEAEIAKNKANAPSTHEFLKAAADYSAAQKTFEKYIETLKPKETAPEPAEPETEPAHK